MLTSFCIYSFEVGDSFLNDKMLSLVALKLLKGSVQRKLRWVKNSINHRVLE